MKFMVLENLLVTGFEIVNVRFQTSAQLDGIEQPSNPPAARHVTCQLPYLLRQCRIGVCCAMRTRLHSEISL